MVFLLRHLLLIFLLLFAGCVSESANLNQFNSVDVYFCPADPCESALIQQINSAQESIDVAIYSFTLDSAGDAIIAAENRGVEVRIVVEEDNASSQYSEYERLLDFGVDIRLDSNEDLMHHKFAVIDGERVVTGSFNWTRSGADRNNENLVVISSGEIAKEFSAEFDGIFNVAN